MGQGPRDGAIRVLSEQHAAPMRAAGLTLRAVRWADDGQWAAYVHGPDGRILVRATGSSAPEAQLEALAGLRRLQAQITEALEVWNAEIGLSAGAIEITGKMTDLECPESGEGFRGIEVSHNPEDDELAGQVIHFTYRADGDERAIAQLSALEWAQGWLARGARHVTVIRKGT